MRDTQPSLKRNDYAFDFVQDPYRRFSRCQLPSSSPNSQLVKDPIWQRVGQHKGYKRFRLKERMRRQLADNPVSRIKASRPGSNFTVFAIHQSICCRQLKINAGNVAKIPSYKISHPDQRRFVLPKSTRQVDIVQHNSGSRSVLERNDVNLKTIKNVNRGW